MWRLQGLVGRALSRCHGNAPLRLFQNHQVDNTSTLSTGRHSTDSSFQKGEDGEKRWKRKTSQFFYAGLPRYTALDAVGWGAAAIVFMQICRKIHSKFSSGGEPSPTPNTGHLAALPAHLHKCGYRVLLEILSRRDVLPRVRTVGCLGGAPERQAQAQAQVQEQSSSSEGNSSLSSTDHDSDHLTADSSFSNHQRPAPCQDSSGPEAPSFSESSPPKENHRGPGQLELENDNDSLSTEEGLAGAAQNLRHVADASIPVILNIIGLESAKSGDNETAFSCFLASARQGYSKAQFNTGVCYERGRGICKDHQKALHYYSQAAAGGHSQAQYRYAKLFLSSRGQQSTEDMNTAISLLERAASAGLKEAQVYLGSLFSKEPIRDGRKSVHYLKMAAESGDSNALLFLGQCYESGFGVRQCFRTAVGFYQQAAQAGNSQAKNLLTPPCGVEEEAVLRSIRSAPCFSAADRLRRSLSTLSGLVPLSTGPSLPLPHSWSTGSISSSTSLSSIPLHLHPLPASTKGNACQWTIGMG